MIGSALFVACDALITALATDVTLTADGVRVSYDAPVVPEDLTADDGDHEAIWLGDADLEYDIPLLTAGHLHRDETIRQTVVIQVLKPGVDSGDDRSTLQRQADDRAVELFTRLQDVLANNVDLGVTDPARFEAVVAGGRWVRGFVPNITGRGALFEGTVEFTARLTPT